jgi:hypothetical protein
MPNNSRHDVARRNDRGASSPDVRATPQNSIEELTLPNTERVTTDTTAFEQTIDRIREFASIEPTRYGDIEISFGQKRSLALTPSLSTESAEIVVSLRHGVGGLFGIQTGAAYRTDDGLRHTASLASTNINTPDAHSYGIIALANLEGLAVGAAFVRGELRESSFTRLSGETTLVRPTRAPHTESLQKTIDTVRMRARSPMLSHPLDMAIDPDISSLPSGPPARSIDFSFSTTNILNKTQLVKCRLDPLSPIVETESLSGGALRTIHSFETTQAAAFFIIGVCNGALTADAARRYNSLSQRILRKIGVDE